MTIDVTCHIFDPATHQYDYATARVITHAEATLPWWEAVERDYVSQEFRAADEIAAMEYARASRPFLSDRAIVRRVAR